MNILYVLYKQDSETSNGYDGIVGVFRNIPDVKTIVKLCGVSEHDAKILVEELSMQTTDEDEADYIFVRTKYFE